jgi:PncC family amidohydrolase
VAYSNAVKQACLGVPTVILQTEGAVSEATARAMAEGVCQQMGSDVGVAITGIAGPSGGTVTKPVGLVYIAVATPEMTFCQRYVFKGDRSAIKQQSAVAALEIILELQTPA